MAARLVKSAIETAQLHEIAGRTKQARQAYEEAYHLSASVSQPLLRATAALGLANLSLGEAGGCTEVAGRPLDEVLLDALKAARDSKTRSRTLEGQLLQLRSRALFAKPLKTAECLDAAVAARFEAIGLLEAGAVETLPWRKVDAVVLLANVPDETPLSEEDLLSTLCRELPKASPSQVAGEVATLYAFWGGTEGLSLKEFLERFVASATPLRRAVDKKPCKAPCEGGLSATASGLERALVALVSKHGAGDWAAKAIELSRQGLDGASGTLDAQELETLWESLKPELRETVDSDAQMSCGHSCSTCPTRHDCQLHDALADIEDL